MILVIKILRELNLGALVDRFDAEKIEPDNVISASDSELTRLGVSTIGDRIRLRDLYSTQGVTNRWKSMIGKLIDQSMVIDYG